MPTATQVLAFELTCPHGSVPLWQFGGESLRAWRARQSDAQHRLGAISGCECGAAEVVLRLVWTAVKPRRRMKRAAPVGGPHA